MTMRSMSLPLSAAVGSGTSCLFAIAPDRDADFGLVGHRQLDFAEFA